MFDIINAIPKNDPQQIQKLRERPWEDLPGDGLDEIPKVIPAVKGDVSNIVVAQQARWHHELSKTWGRNAKLASGLKVDALVPEEINGIGRVIIPRDVEISEIELPDEAAVGETEVGEIPKRVRQSDPHLNELERVYVGFESLVVLEGVGIRAMVANNDTRELGIHRNKGIAIDKLAYEGKLILKVAGPDRAD